MTRDEKVWCGWIIAVACSFGALETSMPTKLCACLRRWLRIKPQRRGHRVLGAALVISVGVFVAHILDQHQGHP